MCNEAARRIAIGELRNDWGETRIPLVFPEGVPNMAPLDSFRITDPTIIIRGVDGRADEAECVTRRWSWPGTGGRPVYNFRSDGRDLRSAPLPDPGRQLLRIYQTRRSQGEAQGQMGLSPHRPRLVLHRRPVAQGRKRRRSLHHAHLRARPRRRPLSFTPGGGARPRPLGGMARPFRPLRRSVPAAPRRQPQRRARAIIRATSPGSSPPRPGSCLPPPRAATTPARPARRSRFPLPSPSPSRAARRAARSAQAQRRSAPAHK